MEKVDKGLHFCGAVFTLAAMIDATLFSYVSRRVGSYVAARCSAVGAVVLAAGMAAAGVPTSYQPGQVAGIVNTNMIDEASGLVAGHGTPGVLWTHNDSGDIARIFAIDTQGRLLTQVSLQNRFAVDFEDIARGPGPTTGVMYLYVGDIGDNPSLRPYITVYRFPEPSVNLSWASSPPSSSLPPTFAIALNLTYPDGAHNAETLFIDPVTGDLFIATKQAGSTSIYTLPAASIASGATMTFVMTINTPGGALVTGGDIAPDGSAIILRGLHFARLWERGPGQSVAQALAGTPIVVPLMTSPAEPQGEAICFADDGQGYYTLSEEENQPLYFFAPVAAEPSCPADFNDDTTVDVSDLFAYINAWLAKTPVADFNENTTVDVSDLFAYINAWLAKC